MEQWARGHELAGVEDMFTMRRWADLRPFSAYKWPGFVLMYPFLYPVVRVLFLADVNPGAYSVGDLLLILVILLVLVGLIYAIVTLLLRAFLGYWGAPIAALITLPLVVGLFGREHLRALGIQRPLEPWHIAGAMGVVVSVALLVWWLARHHRRLHALSALLTLTGILLVLRFIAGITVDRLRASAVVSRSALARDLTRPIPGPDEIPAPVRDIYLVVLDEYASRAVLRERFGFDNSAFEDSLRALGFHVPVVRSNYTETIHALPSLLQAAHVHRAVEELPAGTKDPTLMHHLVERSRVASFLQQRGYRFVFFPSGWWGMSRSNALADSLVEVGSQLGLHWSVAQTELRRATLRETMLAALHDHGVLGDHVRLSLEQFGRLPTIQGPVFGFAHVLSPHSPFVFDPSCGRLPRSLSGDAAKGYVGQLECLNGLVLRMVEKLLRDSAVPPVILLQGDHGTELLEYHTAECAEQISPAAARERLGAFGAYYLPGGRSAAFGDTVSVVNVLGHVLRHYFHATLPPEPDDQYVVVRGVPFEFHKVSSSWLAGNQRPPSSASGQCN